MKAAGLARVMFDAYGEHCGWKAWDGRTMPTWEAVNDAVRSHWEAAAWAAMDSLAPTKGATDALYIRYLQAYLYALASPPEPWPTSNKDGIAETLVVALGSLHAIKHMPPITAITLAQEIWSAITTRGTVSP